jgi:hypothetical protein
MTNQTQHTPAPWFVVFETKIMSNPKPKEDNYSSHFIADLPCDYGYDPKTGTSELLPEIKANARLIAAAPELLHTLRWLLEVYAEVCGIEVSEAHPETAAGKARSAIAKATGAE